MIWETEGDDKPTIEGAELAGTSRVTINARVKSGRCVGVSTLRRGFKLPSWQFEPAIWAVLQPMSKSLGTVDGWQLLAFLESLATALEQGAPLERILALATAEVH